MTSQTFHTQGSQPDAMPPAVRQQLRQAALRRNLRTAAVIGFAVSGGIISTTWLAATAGSTFLAMSAWRYRQLRQTELLGHDRD